LVSRVCESLELHPGGDRRPRTDIPAYASLIVKGGWPAWHGLEIAVAMDALRDYVDNIADVDLRSLEGRSEPVRMAACLKSLARNVSRLGPPPKVG